MVLLRDPVQQTHFLTSFGLISGAERGVMERALDEGFHTNALIPRLRQKPPTRGRREWNCNLKFRVIPPAGPLPGMGPVVIEDILALAMRFRVKRRDSNHVTALARAKILRLPTGPGADRSAFLQCPKETPRRERIDWAPAVGGFRTRAGVPILGRNVLQRGKHGEFDICNRHGMSGDTPIKWRYPRKIQAGSPGKYPSNVTLSATLRASASSLGERIVQQKTVAPPAFSSETRARVRSLAACEINDAPTRS